MHYQYLVKRSNDVLYPVKTQGFLFNELDRCAVCWAVLFWQLLFTITISVLILILYFVVPSMSFAEDHYFISEQTGVINVTIVRTGDISYPSSVICYTRQNTAQVMMDYNERTLTEESRIFFKPGQKVSNFGL